MRTQRARWRHATVLSGQGGCDWLDVIDPAGPRLCGNLVHLGGDWCREHTKKYALSMYVTADWVPLARFRGIDLTAIARQDEAA